MHDNPETYLNPVYARSFPDPFVLKFCGEYFAYSTGYAPEGSVFAILHSRDLVSWTELGSAMRPLADSPPYYWAPEVTYSNGRFYLYYSTGNETLMEIRLAVSDRPDGGFEDIGKRLTYEEFAIDPHMFIDNDGRRYMFYATDFLEHTHIGTGVVVDEMLDWHTLAGNPRPVTRAKYDWQVYDPHRIEKGGVRWHTVEGPTVLKRKGLYYEMFSGGNWQNTTYGVSFAVSDSINNPEEWEQFSNDETAFPILRTLPEVVIGPGHNSVVRGPNNRELYCVYHRWIEGERVLAIDRMDFAGGRIFVTGATTTPQPAPFRPTIANPFNADSSGTEFTGEWEMSGASASSSLDGGCDWTCRLPSESFLCEFSFRVVETGNGSIGFSLNSGGLKIVEVLLVSSVKEIVVKRLEGDQNNLHRVGLPDEFDSKAFHLIRLEQDASRFNIRLDETDLISGDNLASPADSLSLFTKNTRGEFAGFAVTEGFENLFDDSPDIEAHRVVSLGGVGDCRLEDSELIVSSQADPEFIIGMGGSCRSMEFAANIRLQGDVGESDYGLLLLDDNDGQVFRLRVRPDKKCFEITGSSGVVEVVFPLNFDPKAYYQFRLLKFAPRLFVYLDGSLLTDLSVADAAARPAVFCRNASIGLEMHRLTRI